MKRFDLLRSPLLLLAVALLLLNDFVLKAAFHNWLTGKLSDFAGLAAFTIFCCALWPRHVWRVGIGIAIFFAFWKSPHSASLIDMTNAVLPFTIGRTVDYSDLIALPVVWLVCWNANRLPLIDIGRIGVWLTAAVCLFAFTATSQMTYGHFVTTAAEVPGAATSAATEAGLQQVLDDVAERYGLHCSQCRSLSRGRIYVSAGPLMIYAGFDADRKRLLFDVGALATSEDVAEKARPEVARLQASIEQELRTRFPAVSLGAWTEPPTVITVIEVVVPDDKFDQAFAVFGDVLKRAGLKVEKTGNGGLGGQSAEQVRLRALSFSPVLALSAHSCSHQSRFVVWIYRHLPEYEPMQRRMVGDLGSELGRLFGSLKVSPGPQVGPICGQ